MNVTKPPPASKVRRPHAQALADAEAFRALFPPACYRRWEVAGSVRRRSVDCGDVEHVVIPNVGEVEVGNGLFVEKREVNLLWHRLDGLVAGGTLAKHVYGASGYRWGEKYRGADFRGHNQELRVADESNWGGALAIYTGPADFSRRLVTGLLRNRRRNDKGRVWQCRICDVMHGREHVCPACDDTGLIPVSEIVVPDERRYFELCGVAYVEPWERR